MRKSRICITLLVIASAIMAGTASAGGPPTPFEPQKNANATPSPHGLTITIRLNAKVSDGDKAAFSMRVTNNSGNPLHFVSAAVGWSHDGDPATDPAKLSNLPSGTTFTDLDRNWMRIGTLGRGKSFTVTGKVLVADRDTEGGNRGAQMFCIQPFVRVIYPGKPNASWMESGKMSCRLYSVASRG